MSLSRHSDATSPGALVLSMQNVWHGFPRHLNWMKKHEKKQYVKKQSCVSGRARSQRHRNLLFSCLLYCNVKPYLFHLLCHLAFGGYKLPHALSQQPNVSGLCVIYEHTVWLLQQCSPCSHSSKYKNVPCTSYVQWCMSVLQQVTHWDLYWTVT